MLGVSTNSIIGLSRNSRNTEFIGSQCSNVGLRGIVLCSQLFEMGNVSEIIVSCQIASSVQIKTQQLHNHGRNMTIVLMFLFLSHSSLTDVRIQGIAAE